DHVPPGAAEDSLDLVDDIAVAAYRPVEALEVAVDDADQLVERLARSYRDRAERLRLVTLVDAVERPDHAPLDRHQAATLLGAHEAGLVDRHDRAETHRHRGVLPEVGHQPRVRVGRQAAPLGRLAAEVLELRARQAPLEERARVHAGGR